METLLAWSSVFPRLFAQNTHVLNYNNLIWFCTQAPVYNQCVE